MPWSSPRYCPTQGCTNLLRGREARCPDCQREVYRRVDAGRPEAHRFYGSQRWRKLAALQLKTEPLCRQCRARGELVPATIADHVIDREDGGADTLDNLQSLCHRCHNRKHADLRRGKRGGEGKS